MFSFVKRTLMRGRSPVPRTFRRTRQWRSCASLCFCSVLISLRHGFCREPNFLLHCLALLALDVFARVAHALALVRFRRIEAAKFGGDLADKPPVRAFNRQFR